MAKYPKRKGKKGYKKKSMVPFKNPLGAGIPNDLRKFRLKMMGMVPVSFTGNGGVSLIGYAFPLNNPTIYRSPATTWGQISGAGTAISNVWTRCFGAQAIFDEYKVISLRVRFVPSEQETHGNTSAYDTVDQPSLVYSFNDLDDSNLITTEAYMLNRGVYPKSYTEHPVTFHFKQLPEKRKIWLNTANYSLNPTTAATVATGPMVDQTSSLKLLFATGTTNLAVASVGRLYAEWDVLFRGLNSSAGV